ncbi:MAG TPA: cupredoxin domain-containing protein [Acidimicrobiia bacterium]|nr:cupredoxin domain-containing protein [Acidimicrobiia bacterium]
MAVVVLTGCASDRQARQANRVVVVEHDYGLVASSRSVQAGTVTFQIENRGPSTHEFMIDETSLPADGLPLEANGLRVDEHSPRLHNVVSDDLRVGATHELSVRLQPGTYVIFCNFEGHYLGGMHLGLNVTA